MKTRRTEVKKIKNPKSKFKNKPEKTISSKINKKNSFPEVGWIQ
jgi:hypothetical protein